MIHKTVLLHETIDALDIKEGDIVFEGTLGGGGHSEEILKRKNRLTLIANDLDEDATLRSKARLDSHIGKHSQIFYTQGNFHTIDKIVQELGLDHVDKILLDLGLSSHQLEESGRGFTFQKDEPLEMTFSKSTPADTALTVHDIINTFEEQNLADIIYGYGEERFSRRIAKAIVEARELHHITRTLELASIIKEAVPERSRHGRTHPATKTFQALRIAVNDELGALQTVLAKGFELLASEGRMAVISFHSLEDRIVKNFFREKAVEGVATLYTKKPLSPSAEEIIENPRSRSAKLRALIKN